MRRREFMAGLGSAAAWPIAVAAQPLTVPVVGYLSSRSPDVDATFVAAFRQGLKDAGHVEGRSFTIEFRWANNQIDRLPALAAELVQRRPAVIAAITGNAPALAAKAATTTIPIVFNTGDDPVALGLIARLNRPGGNITGVATLAVELVPKELEMLCAAVPNATLIASLSDRNPVLERDDRSEEAAARLLGRSIAFLRADTEREIEDAFTRLSQLRADALFIRQSVIMIGHIETLGQMSLRYKIPAINVLRAFAAAGGLMSYGISLTDAYRLAGTYVGRILKGEKPADLPVQQLTKIELVINMRTAKALGLTIPPTVLAIADAVIE
jgi:putative ABC transport system substrate-binding protein